MVEVAGSGNFGDLLHEQGAKQDLRMTNPDDRVCYIGRTNFRNQQKRFGIRQADRLSHMYIIGQTGTGKSTLMETMIRQDIEAGQGLMLLDPHGDLAEKLKAWLPERCRDRVVFWDVADTEKPLGFNPLSPLMPHRRVLMASFVLDAFKKLWPDFWGPRLEHVFRNALLVLLDQPSATLADVNRLFIDSEFRRRAAMMSGNPAVRHFWLDEFDRYPVRLQAEAVAPIQNKIGAFLAHPILQQIVTQSRSSFSLREIMDCGRILIVSLPRGKLGEDAVSLLGSLLVSAAGVTALSRADLPEERRRDFFIFLDEFQCFTTQALATMLPELRKYKVGLALAHQHLGQLDEEVKASVLGNVGTTMCFRVGSDDAEDLVSQFGTNLTRTDLTTVANYHYFARLMIVGVVSPGFSGQILKLQSGLLALDRIG